MGRYSYIVSGLEDEIADACARAKADGRVEGRREAMGDEIKIDAGRDGLLYVASLLNDQANAELDPFRMNWLRRVADACEEAAANTKDRY